MRERTRTVSSHDERVFDPDATLLGEVHTRLDRDDVTGGELGPSQDRRDLVAERRTVVLNAKFGGEENQPKTISQVKFI